ncbi:transcriptional regulator BetI [Maribrevibacterium harenarium]|uniref:HTH-type transcriptional regulator BetI n=1 Tax=Maribrevibacterium harenarium TaxID=2589817 RepID=A0A501WK39_9GAMM|nr:transcriptional regulator BetI [Maribrevibacterium harenarium]TPE47401.1 transcriptional regulator BetI [Maribrevibacterium harenarium]
MPKVGMPEIRKPQLIQATINAIDEFGFPGATVSVIGKKAGVSPAIINHYFGGKEGLLEATMRSLIKEFFEVLQAELYQARNGTTMDRAMAIVRASISQSQTRPQVVKAWMGFWASAMHMPVLYRLQNVYSRRLQSSLVAVFRERLEAEPARDLAFTVAALIDGMWLRGSLAGGIDSDYAADRINEYISLALTRP